MNSRGEGGDEVLHRADDVLVLDERHLDVELGELGLAGGPEVFIPEAAGDLEVAVEPGDHQHLLVELGRLRERIEVAGWTRLGTRKSRAPSGVLRPRMGVSTSRKAEARHGVAHQLRHLVAEDEDPLHRRPTEVEVAILEPEFLVGLGAAVDLEGGRGRGVEDLQLGGPNLDGAGLELGVLLAGRRGATTPLTPMTCSLRSSWAGEEGADSPSAPGSKTTWVRP